MAGIPIAHLALVVIRVLEYGRGCVQRLYFSMPLRQLLANNFPHDNRKGSGEVRR